jgi:hypothetical protein
MTLQRHWVTAWEMVLMMLFEGPSPVALHSRLATLTPRKRTVQPWLAVTIWFPETLNSAGAADARSIPNT